MIDNIMQKSQPLLLCIIGALIVFCIASYLTPAAKQIATIDVLAITQQFVKSERDKNISEEAIKKDSIVFGQQLEKTIKQFSKNHPQVVLLPKEAVMAGGEDYTAVVTKYLQNALAKTNDMDLS
jgi:hypothetical protein